MVLIALGLPGGDFLVQELGIGDPAIQTLCRKNREFAFGHIEPTAMFGRVVKLQLARDPASLSGRKRLVQRRWRMGVEIIHHQPDQLSLGEIDLNQQLHLVSEVLLGALRGHVHLAPAQQGLHAQKQIRGAFAFVLIVITCRLAGARRQRTARFADQLHRALVKADLRAPRIVRLGVQIRYIFHMPDKFRAHAGNTPAFVLPGLKVVFLSTRRTVSCERVPTCWSSIKRSARSCIVQRRRTAGQRD